MKTDPPESSKYLKPALTPLDRRALLLGGGAALAGLATAGVIRERLRQRASVFVARDQRYEGPLEQTIREGLIATGLSPEGLRDKRVLLKPNLVEPSKKIPHMTTHPAVIVATAEVFRRWGANVIVGEGPGHVRDTEMALIESGVQEALDSAKLEFADLNYQEVGWVPNRGKSCELPGFFFPQAVMEADLVVSMPKLKTHHWVGFTASMKNLYGTIPGIKYGWPKNVLHHNGIPQTVFDINASLPKTVAVVDGIVGMEGDGPIMGSAKPMGLLLVSTNLAAVDATIARIMGLAPERVGYMQLAAGQIGPIQDKYIEQRGERWQNVASPFQIVNRPYLQQLRIQPGELVS